MRHSKKEQLKNDVYTLLDQRIDCSAVWHYTDCRIKLERCLGEMKLKGIKDLVEEKTLMIMWLIK